MLSNRRTLIDHILTSRTCLCPPQTDQQQRVLQLQEGLLAAGLYFSHVSAQPHMEWFPTRVHRWVPQHWENCDSRAGELIRLPAWIAISGSLGIIMSRLLLWRESCCVGMSAFRNNWDVFHCPTIKTGCVFYKWYGRVEEILIHWSVFNDLISVLTPGQGTLILIKYSIVQNKSHPEPPLPSSSFETFIRSTFWFSHIWGWATFLWK